MAKSYCDFQAQLKNRTSQHTTKFFNRACKADTTMTQKLNIDNGLQGRQQDLIKIQMLRLILPLTLLRSVNVRSSNDHWW